jgi:tRNA-splicing ligase RtcB
MSLTRHPGDARVLQEHGYYLAMRELASAVELRKSKPGTPVYRVKTETGRTLTAAADQWVYTLAGKVRVASLSVGERVALYPFEGVAYEAPSCDVILDERGLNRFLDTCPRQHSEKIRQRWFDDLEERGLLPLRCDTPALASLLKLVGYVLADGSIEAEGDGSYRVIFPGGVADLEDIRADVAALGFEARATCSRPRLKRAPGAQAAARLYHTSRCDTTAFAILLAALGCPIGRKTDQAYRLPAWITGAPLWQKRLFLAAFLGGNLRRSKARASSRSFSAPIIVCSKRLDLIESAREFLNDTRDMLREFGVRTSEVIHHKGYDRARLSGEIAGRCEMTVSGGPENLLALHEKVGFVYNRRKMALGLQLSHYLRRWSLALKERQALAARAVRLHGKLGAGAEKILEAMGSPPGIDVVFIQHAIYEGRRPRRLGAAALPRFDDFSREAGGEGGMVFDAVVSKEPVAAGQGVYGFAPNQPSRDFIVESFVMSNGGEYKQHGAWSGQNIAPVLTRLGI